MRGFRDIGPAFWRTRLLRSAQFAVRKCFTALPIWARFNKTTGHFCDIRDRLEASYLAPRLVRSGGHIWMALDVPLGSDGVQIVNALVVQAEEIVRVAYRPKP